MTRDDFAMVKRGCPFINASAEFTGGHTTRVQAASIRNWFIERIEDLLRQVGHRSPRSTAQQLMMVRTGAIVSGALDHNDQLTEDYLECWNQLVDEGLTQRVAARPGRPGR